MNDGWRVALTTLMNERASIGSGTGGSGSGVASIDRLAGILGTLAMRIARGSDEVMRNIGR